MPRTPEITLVTKFGSKSIGTPDGEPRVETIDQNAAELARARDSGLLVVMVSSGAELFGGKLVLTPGHREYLSKRKKQIHNKYRNNEAEQEKRVRELNLSVTHHIHRVGQKRLMEVWESSFDRYGIPVLSELLDGERRDLSEEIRMAEESGAIMIFNGHGSLGKAGDNDLNLPDVVDWVAPDVDEEDEDPEDPITKLHVLGLTDPGTRGLLTRSARTIKVYRGGTLNRLDHPDKVISKGGPESKALAFFAIKERHPHQSRVGISANRGRGTIANFLEEGRADTIIELRKNRQMRRAA